MIFRIIVILACVLVFVNSCNSLISRVAGTHKLRTFTMEELSNEGLGDADYVEITGTITTSDYIFEPNRKASWPGFVQYPVLSQAQADSLANGHQVTVYLVAWTQRYEEACVNNGNCVTASEGNIKGLVRPLNKRFNKTEELPKNKYQLAETPVYIEVSRKPLDWYWSLLFMILAVALAFGMERWLSKKESKNA